MKTFPLTYEISSFGDCRKRVKDGFRYFSQIDEPEGTFVYIPVKQGQLQKCLLAELVLLSFNDTYRLGDQIKHRDGNIHNNKISNLKHRRVKQIFDNVPLRVDTRLKGLWGCESRAYTANSRSASKGMIITPDDVLRCLIVCGYKCFYCERGLSPRTWNLDHHIPLSKDGTNEFNNLRASCKYCNTMKSNMAYQEWMAKIHRILAVYIKHNPEHKFSSEYTLGFAQLVEPVTEPGLLQKTSA